MDDLQSIVTILQILLGVVFGLVCRNIGMRQPGNTPMRQIGHFICGFFLNIIGVVALLLYYRLRGKRDTRPRVSN